MFKGRPSDTDEMASQQPPPPPTAAPPPPVTADPANSSPSQLSYGHSSESTMGQEPEIVEAYEDDRPTDSHYLADMATKEKPIEEKGHAELDHGDIEVKNLGWNNPPSRVPQPMVGGLTNEELWILVRRFDKQIFHVKSISEPPLASLDMNIADEEEFSPDKLRAHIERLYMTVVVGAFSFWKHIVRVRSWREWKRTSTFLAVYTIAWILDFVVPVLVSFLIVLVLVPEARDFCFPPAPASLIDSKTGGVKKPASGVLASDDSITGAPEKHAGEAVEQEAHSFVNSISSLIVSTAAGKHPQGDPHNDTSVPDPTNITEDVVNAKDKAGVNVFSSKSTRLGIGHVMEHVTAVRIQQRLMGSNVNNTCGDQTPLSRTNSQTSHAEEQTTPPGPQQTREPLPPRKPPPIPPDEVATVIPMTALQNPQSEASSSKGKEPPNLPIHLRDITNNRFNSKGLITHPQDYSQDFQGNIR
ncbi:hypothetical protein EsH8_VI_001079 [Colletotrichum jinshuiense]